MKSQKHLFSLDSDVHYLNCAYKAPLLQSVEAAGIKALVQSRNPYQLTPEDYFSEVDQVKEQFAQIVHCHRTEVALLPSSSYGFASVLNNVDASEGQFAITIGKEFPSGYFAIERWCKEKKAQLTIIEPDTEAQSQGESWNSKIVNAINEQTAVVLLSSVHWMSGFKFDLQAIGAQCRSVGAKFIVDGTQSVGAAPIDVKKCQIDALICAGYKWLFGPYSTGLAYIGAAFNGGKPIEESWMNRQNARHFSQLTDYDSNYTPDAGRYSVGETSNFILMPMLHKALKQVNVWGPEQVETYCSRLAQPLIQFLIDNGIKVEHEKWRSAHLFAIQFPDNCPIESVRELLEVHKVYVSVRGNGLRVALHLFNDESDIAALMAALKTLLRK